MERESYPPFNTGKSFDILSQFAERANKLKQSEIRNLFSVANRPDIISLAGGMPNLEDLDFKKIDSLISEIILSEGNTALQYGGGQGLPLLREQITEIMALEGIKSHSEDIILTTGSQQALDLTARLFINPGDVILVESPSYVGALGTFMQYQPEIIHLPTDEDGIIPELLEESLIANIKAGKKTKFLYLVPNFQNPSSATLTLARRVAIIELAKKYSFFILEDNPYGLLYFETPPPPALRSLNEEHVIYLGTFSKTFAPGLRVGWALVPHSLREKFIIATENSNLSLSNLNQMVISAYLSETPYQEQIRKFAIKYAEKSALAISALKKYSPSEVKYTTPKGGFYLWLTLPPSIDANKLLPLAIINKVAYVPGTAFYANKNGNHNLRLSFCYPKPEQITRGVQILGELLSAEVALKNKN